MPSPTILVNASTSIVLIDTSLIASNDYALVYLSTLAYPGTVITIKDLTGYASLTKPIVLSTTFGITFQDGRFSTLITQPNGYYTVSARQSGTQYQWQVLNSFAFANYTDNALLKNVAADVINVTNLEVAVSRFSTLSTVDLYVSRTLSSGGSTILGETLVRSNVLILESLSTQKNIYASTLTIQNSIVGSNLTLTQTSQSFPTLINEGLSYFANTVSISSYLNVLNSVTVRDTTILQSTLVVKDAVIVSNTFSTLSSIGIGDSLYVSVIQTPLTLNNALRTNSTVSMWSNLRVEANQHVNFLGDLQVSNQTTLSSILHVGGNALFYNSVSTLQETVHCDVALFQSSVTIQQNSYICSLQYLDVVSTAFFRSFVNVSTQFYVGGTSLFQNSISTIGFLNTINLVNFQSTGQFLQNVSIGGTLVVGSGLSSLGSTLLRGPLTVSSNVFIHGGISSVSSIWTGGGITMSTFSSLGDSIVLGKLVVVGDLTVNRITPVSANMVFDKGFILNDAGNYIPSGTNGIWIVNSNSTLRAGYSNTDLNFIQFWPSLVTRRYVSYLQTSPVHSDRYIYTPGDSTYSYVSSQGAYMSWNGPSGNGKSMFICARGLSSDDGTGGGFRFVIGRNENPPGTKAGSGVFVTENEVMTMNRSTIGINNSNPSNSLALDIVGDVRIQPNATMGGTGDITVFGSLKTNTITTRTGNVINFNSNILSNIQTSVSLLSITSSIRLSDGTVNAPSLCWPSPGDIDLDSGFYHPADGRISVSINKGEKWRWEESYTYCFNTLSTSAIRCTTLTASEDVTVTSDRRMKTEISSIASPLEKVLQMKGVTYSPIYASTTRKVGFIAQELETVLPEVVSTDESGTKSVAYGNITALLVEAVKQLTSTVKSIESRLSVVESPV